MKKNIFFKKAYEILNESNLDEYIKKYDGKPFRLEELLNHKNDLHHINKKEIVINILSLNEYLSDPKNVNLSHLKPEGFNGALKTELSSMNISEDLLFKEIRLWMLSFVSKYILSELVFKSELVRQYDTIKSNFLKREKLKEKYFSLGLIEIDHPNFFKFKDEELYDNHLLRVSKKGINPDYQFKELLYIKYLNNFYHLSISQCCILISVCFNFFGIKTTEYAIRKRIYKFITNKRKIISELIKADTLMHHKEYKPYKIELDELIEWFDSSIEKKNKK